MSNLLGLSHASLSALLAARGAAPYRLSQLLRALYSSPRASAVSSLLCFSAAERASLSAAGVSIDGGAVADERRSADGTVKWLISLPEPQRAQSVETVFIPPLPGSGEGGGDDSEDEAEDSARRPRAPRGGTLCVSSQAGCSLRCAFCHTGTQAMTGNLPAAAIVAQFVRASERLEAGAGCAPAAIRNVVFMGQGEPLLNWRGVRGALEVLTSAAGVAPRRITVSTAGVAPLIERFAEEAPLGVRLAVSLHAASDALRSKLMPINRTYDIATLMKACARHVAAATGGGGGHRGQHAGRITFEVALLAGVNDGAAHADALAALLRRHLPPRAAHVNLLPFHPWPGAPFTPSPPAALREFRERLTAAGLRTHVRKSRGMDILAACGQLRSSALRKPPATGGGGEGAVAANEATA